MNQATTKVIEAFVMKWAPINKRKEFIVELGGILEVAAMDAVDYITQSPATVSGGRKP